MEVVRDTSSPSVTPGEKGPIPRGHRIFDPGFATPGGAVPDFTKMSPGEISAWVRSSDVVPAGPDELKDLLSFSYHGTYGDPIPFRVSLMTTAVWYMVLPVLAIVLLMAGPSLGLSLDMILLLGFLALSAVPVFTCAGTLKYLHALRRARLALAQGYTMEHVRQEVKLPHTRAFVLLSLPKGLTLLWGLLLFLVYFILQAVTLVMCLFPGLIFLWFCFCPFCLALAICLDRGIGPLKSLAFGFAVIRKLGGTARLIDSAPGMLIVEILVGLITQVYLLWDLVQICEGWTLAYAWLVGLNQDRLPEATGPR